MMKRWTGKRIITAGGVAGAIATIIGTVWAAANWGDKRATAYVEKVAAREAEHTFIRMYAPQDALVKNMSRDMKLTILMLDELVPPQKKARALKKLADTTWKTH